MTGAKESKYITDILSMKLFKKMMLLWLMVGFIFWTFYISQIEFIHQMLYYYFIVFLIGVPIWIYRIKIKDKLENWKLNKLTKFIILGYCTVLFEEVFAALFNHLSEGFNLILYLQRIGQFWALNIFAFAGFYFGWYFLLRRYKYSYTEVFFIAGVWGLFTERVIYELFTNSLYVFFMTPIMIFVYGLMITLPMLSSSLDGKNEIHPLIKYFLSILVLYLFSVVPILILELLRTIYPWAFPPVVFVPL